MPSPSSSAFEPGRAALRGLRLRLLSQLDQRYGREKRILRRTICSLEERLRRERVARGNFPKDFRAR